MEIGAREQKDLWPSNLDVEVQSSPESVLQRQSAILKERTGGRIEATLRPRSTEPWYGPPFYYGFVLHRPDGDFGHDVIIFVYRRGLDPYPLTVDNEDEIGSCLEFERYVAQRLDSLHVMSALRYLLAADEPVLHLPDLWPSNLDLSPLSSPVSLLEQQARAICERTHGRVTAEVNEAGWCVDGWPPFSFELVENTPWSRFNRMRYQVFTVTLDGETYPVTVEPGSLVFRNEHDFAEFVRQELASENVRKAVRALMAKTLLCAR